MANTTFRSFFVDFSTAMWKTDATTNINSHVASTVPEEETVNIVNTLFRSSQLYSISYQSRDPDDISTQSDAISTQSDAIATEITHPRLSSPATYEQQIALTVVIIVLGLWSIFGNILTILAITMHRNMRTKANFFILSLATSDLISAAIASPLWLYRRTWGFYHWEWGQFCCYLFWGTDESTSYCTALHIASFAALRLIGVKKPSYFRQIEKKTIIIIIAILWTLAIVCGGFAYASFFKVIKKPATGPSSCWPMCSINIYDNGISKHRRYYYFSSITFMFLPMAVLLVASFAIIYELKTNKIAKNDKRKKDEKRIAVQLMLIVSSFLVGYIPLNAYMLATSTSSLDCLTDYWFNVGAYLSLRMSECVNPVLYNLASKKMRKASLNVLNNLRTCFTSVVPPISFSIASVDDSKAANAINASATRESAEKSL